MEKPEVVRVLVVDGSHAVRTGIRQWLANESDLVVVGMPCSAVEAIRQVSDLRVHVVVMDVRLPDQCGMAACRQIINSCPSVAVLILSDLDRDAYLAEAWAAGATGFMPKQAEKGLLIEAIRSAARGKLLFTQDQRRRIRAWEQSVGERLNALSPREWTVLRLLIHGKQNQEIAATLVLSLSTVEKHVGAVLAKFGVRSRLELLAFVLQNDLGARLDGGFPLSQNGGLSRRQSAHGATMLGVPDNVAAL